MTTQKLEQLENQFEKVRIKTNPEENHIAEELDDDDYDEVRNFLDEILFSDIVKDDNLVYIMIRKMPEGYLNSHVHVEPEKRFTYDISYMEKNGIEVSTITSSLVMAKYSPTGNQESTIKFVMSKKD